MSTDFPLPEFPEVERYELREAPKYSFQANRREFVQTLGAGVVIAVAASNSSAQQRRGGRGNQGGGANRPLNQRFHIAETGIVTVLTSKVEIGQGSRTQITQAAAEELHLPVSQIQLIMADTELCPDDGGTAGSRTTPATVPAVRTASAAAREVLATFAAKKLGVERAAVKVVDGVFTAGEGKKLTLAEIAAAAELKTTLAAPPPAGATLARVDQWQVLGTSVPKPTGQSIVTGKHQYASDIRRDNMLYGKVLRQPSYNATLESIDLAPAKAMAGVVVVQDGNFIGVAAPTSYQARQAVAAIAATAKWTQPAQVSSDELYAHFKRAAGAGRGGRGARGGGAAADPMAALASAAKKFTASYHIPYIAHAPMEPRAAVAEWTDNHGKLTVWTGSQQPSRVQSDLAQAFRLAADRVRVIVPDTGGGFGGKHSGEAAVEAARLAKAAGRPVSLRWTREEEFTWAYFRPAGLIEVQAGLDAAGKLVAWDFVNYNSGGSAVDSPYTIAASRSRFVGADSPLRQGSYRALASTANTFARESAMDELAELAGVDPLAFRLAHLPAGRLKDVLQAAADKFGWAKKREKAAGEKNRGVGIACGTEKGSYVAACAEVEVAAGKIKIVQICQAYECGAIQNPANLRAQCEGAIIMGLGGALTEHIDFKDGKITNPAFSAYPVPRLADVPPLDLVILNRTDLPSVGAGETPIIAVAPALGNAVWQAVKARCKELPLRAKAV